MNIVFLGTTRGKTAVSSNLVAISSMAAVKYNMDVAVMQSKFDFNRIENAFMPISSYVCMKEDFAYYKRQGIDEVIDGIKMNREGNLVEDSIVKVKNTSLYYLPSTSETSEEIFNKECENIAKIISKYVANTRKAAFIDCGDGRNTLSRELIGEADVVVINIEQDNSPIPKELYENKSFMEKCLFVIGRYDSDSRFNLRNIKRKYHIDDKCIAAVPYNVAFKDSVCEGKVIDFMDRNIMCNIYEDNYEFINGVDCAAKMILRKAGCNV